jgi:hypothetical protein
VVTVNRWRKSSYSFANGNCAEVAAWRKSTASVGNGACAEVGAWRKSSHSVADGHCAEIGQDGAVVGVRDSQDPDGPVLVFGPVAWAAFLAMVRQT